MRRNYFFLLKILCINVCVRTGMDVNVGYNDAVSPSSLFALPFCSDCCLFYPVQYYSVMALHRSLSFCSLFFFDFSCRKERKISLTMSLRERKNLIFSLPLTFLFLLSTSNNNINLRNKDDVDPTTCSSSTSDSERCLNHLNHSDRNNNKEI